MGLPVSRSLQQARKVQELTFRNLETLQSELTREGKAIDPDILAKAVDAWLRAQARTQDLLLRGPIHYRKGKINGSHPKPTKPEPRAKPQDQTPAADPVKPMRAQDVEAPATDPTFAQ